MLDWKSVKITMKSNDSSTDVHVLETSELYKFLVIRRVDVLLVRIERMRIYNRLPIVLR